MSSAWHGLLSITYVLIVTSQTGSKSVSNL